MSRWHFARETNRTPIDGQLLWIRTPITKEFEIQMLGPRFLISIMQRGKWLRRIFVRCRDWSQFTDKKIPLIRIVHLRQWFKINRISILNIEKVGQKGSFSEVFNIYFHSVISDGLEMLTICETILLWSFGRCILKDHWISLDNVRSTETYLISRLSR